MMCTLVRTIQRRIWQKFYYGIFYCVINYRYHITNVLLQNSVIKYTSTSKNKKTSYVNHFFTFVFLINVMHITSSFTERKNLILKKRFGQPRYLKRHFCKKCFREKWKKKGNTSAKCKKEFPIWKILQPDQIELREKYFRQSFAKGHSTLSSPNSVKKKKKKNLWFKNKKISPRKDRLPKRRKEKKRDSSKFFTNFRE